MIRMKKYLSAALAAIMCGTMMTVNRDALALNIADPVDSDCYGDNLGDSFIDVIDTRNGNMTVDGITYETGIELWVARYNYKKEQSWVWATYKVDPSETEFKGTLSVLKDSYNIKEFDTTLEISVDDKLVYSYRMTPGFAPQSIDIPLKGASEIKFYVYDNSEFSGGTSFCIGTGTGYMLGDVNDDGTINAVDASMVLSEYARKATGQTLTFSEIQKKAADVNDDSDVNAVDASKILSYYAYKATGGTLLFADYLDI